MPIKIYSKKKDGTITVHYTSKGSVITPKETAKADEIDKKIKKAMREIEDRAKKKGLLDLLGKKGKVIQLYYFVGLELKKFIDSLNLSEDEILQLWSPINHHAEKLSLDQGTSRLIRDKGYRSTWRYCYLLAQRQEKDVLEYDWTQWVDIFDSKICEDKRVVDWLIRIKRDRFKGGGMQDWFRDVMRSVRKEFTVGRKMVTHWMTDEDMEKLLESCYDKKDACGKKIRTRNKSKKQPKPSK